MGRTKKGRSEAEIRLPLEVIDSINGGKCLCVFSTFSEVGIPLTTPLHYMCVKGMASIIAMVNSKSESYTNLCWQKKVALCFFDKNNVSWTITGRIGVVRAPSFSHPDFNVVRIDVIRFISDKSDVIKIDGGVKWSYLSDQAKEMGEYIMDELRTLAGLL